MSANVADPPQQTDLVSASRDRTGRTSYLITSVWFLWFIDLIKRIQTSAQVLNVTTLTAQAASISTTPIPLASTVAGVYRLSWYARITQAATTSSSLTVTLGWTEGGISLTVGAAAITGNSTTTTQTGSLLVQVDQAAAISYATTYVSVGATPMQYALRVVVELVS